MRGQTQLHRPSELITVQVSQMRVVPLEPGAQLLTPPCDVLSGRKETRLDSSASLWSRRGESGKTQPLVFTAVTATN